MHHKTLCVVFPLARLQRQQKDEWIGLCPYSAIIDYKIFITRKYTSPRERVCVQKQGDIGPELSPPAAI